MYNGLSLLLVSDLLVLENTEHLTDEDSVRYVVDDFRRTVLDRSTGQKVILSDEDIALARSLVNGKYSDASYNPYEVNITHTR